MRRRVKHLLADESGLTLAELLVTMIISIIVVIALFTFQDVVLKGSSRTIAKVDATQRARGAMATLASRLHSSCIAENVTPVQAGSTDAKLSFISQYGSAATLTPEKHTVTVNTNGTLTDATYPLASGTAANPTFSNAASSTVTLLDHVNPSTSAEPAFRYYAYGIAKDSGGGEYQDAAGNPYMVLLDGTATLPNGTRTSSGTTVPDGTLPANSPTTLSAVAPSGLGSADAKLTSAVAINLTVKPAGKLGNTTDAMVPATLTDTVVLRLTPVPSEGNLPSVSPCE